MQIVCTQQSVLDLLELSASSLLEPDAQSTDIESDSESVTTDCHSQYSNSVRLGV